MDAPAVDLAFVFQSKAASFSKQEAREEAQAAAAEYTRLLDTLRNAGLKAVGKKGDGNDEIIVLVSCPWPRLVQLVERERHTDFVHGLSSATLPSLARDFSSSPLSPADRLRLVHTYVTSSTHDGGLGIEPQTKNWKRVQSVTALHDKEFNDVWISSWTRNQLGFGVDDSELDKLKDQFGESVALYFSFLTSYSQALILPTFLGVVFYRMSAPYSSIYSSIIVLWSVTFVEWWRIRERKLAVRWGTRGSAAVEKRRVDFHGPTNEDDDEKAFPWWKRELRMIASIPVIMFFAAALAALLTAIFVFEAFVTQLYTGPLHQFASLAPTILFMALVPRLLGLYQTSAVHPLTNWENHVHHSAHEASLATKTFSLSAVVAYLGIALSAFVYLPFGELIMAHVHTSLFAKHGTSPAGHATDKIMANQSAAASTDILKGKINPSRLQDQMFAFTVTNQVINTFLEAGLPFILRAVTNVRGGRGLNGKKKHVTIDPTAAANGSTAGEQDFLDDVRRQVALPAYSIFTDYSEMVTQFGYIALYSTIWPLAPACALLNNWLELRSDALKITVHARRPIPARTDTIGPWLNSLGFITWAAALTNSALVYLFQPSIPSDPQPGHFQTTFNKEHVSFNASNMIPDVSSTLQKVLIPAVLIALSSSHAYLLARHFVRHVLERAIWRGSKEQRAEAERDRKLKTSYLEAVVLKGQSNDVAMEQADEGLKGIWAVDEGLPELEKSIKMA